MTAGFKKLARSWRDDGKYSTLTLITVMAAPPFLLVSPCRYDQGKTHFEVLKTAVRKDMQVRVLSPPPLFLTTLSRRLRVQTCAGVLTWHDQKERRVPREKRPPYVKYLKVVLSERTFVAAVTQATILETGAPSRRDTNHSFPISPSVLFRRAQFSTHA
jgi:hypothetical protein